MQLDASIRELIQAYAFDAALWQTLKERLKHQNDLEKSNVVKSELRPATYDDLRLLPSWGTQERLHLESIGAAAIAQGHVAAIVLAGGMATRFKGEVKALVPVKDNLTFADLKQRAMAHAAHQYQHPIPMWWMSSFLTHAPLDTWAQHHRDPRVPASMFCQSVLLRLTPDGELFVNDDAFQSVYSPGHGDLIAALSRTSLLEQFIATGGKYLFVSNVDNLVATLDPALIGAHITGEKAITVETVEKHPGDQGGAPAWLDGSLQIIEAFRFPPHFDQDQIPVFNTNTFVLNAEILQQAHPLDWFAVSKAVKGHTVIQYEQLLGQLTAFVPSQYIRVDREGPQSRFIPVKTPEELEHQRERILETLHTRGIDC